MSGIKILNAVYGSGSKTVDVTAAVASHVKDGQLNLTVTADSLGIENPAPGAYNQLTVSYTVNDGDTNTSTTSDNGVLTISAPPARKAIGLQIDKAEYGYKGNFVDVTDAMRSLVKDGSIDVTVNPKNMGVPDPDPSKQKELKVTYSLNGSKNSTTIKDNSQFKISAPATEVSNTATPSEHVGKIFLSLFKHLFYFVGLFLYILSIYASKDFGSSIGFQTPMMILGAVLPFIAFWGLPVYVFIRRLFYTTDLVIVPVV